MKLRENNLRVTQKYYEIHEVNSHKAVLSLYMKLIAPEMKLMMMMMMMILFLGSQPHGVECQSLCGSEVTRKIKQLEVEGGGAHAP